MKINPNDPWYPTRGSYGNPGVPIRLKLAAEMMKSPHLEAFCPDSYSGISRSDFIEGAFRATDAMIERVNRDEGKHDDKV